MADEIATHILSALKEKFGCDAKLSDPVVELGVDSVGIAEMLFDLESRYGITVDEHVLVEATVGELVEYVRERIAAKVGG